jgi:hypothetical protein
VPFQRAASELCLPGTPVRIPRLLVEGGRELEALQASVHRIRRPS